MKRMLSEELYRHSLGVAKAAASLAEYFGESKEKAYLTGIVHDYGKRYTPRELIEKAEKTGLCLDRVTRQESRLLHAPVGAALLKTEVKLEDPRIIRAVYYHTTGRKGMNGLEKAIYLADYIEDGRDFPEAEKIRELARSDPEQAMLEAVEFAIKSVLRRGLLLHPRSVAFRNSLLEKKREGSNL